MAMRGGDLRMDGRYRPIHLLRSITRHLPLPGHPNAYQAARLAECAATQGRFEAVHRILYSAVALSAVDPAALADAAHIPDPGAFVMCASQVAKVPRIEADIGMAREIEINAVPAVIFQGTLLGTPPDSASLFRMVEQDLGPPTPPQGR